MDCNFPAKELLAERKRIAALADTSDDPGFVDRCAKYVVATDQLRILHEEATLCNCWYDAVRATEPKGLAA
jgi:hypothetical protein